MKVAKTFFIPLLLPSFILLLGFITYDNLDILPPDVLDILYYGPYLLFLSSMVLSFRFNRSRIFFVTLSFLVFYIGVSYYDSWQTLDAIPVIMVYNLAGLFIPLNLLLFSFLKERGFLTFWGILRIVFICTEFILCLWLLTNEDPTVLAWLTASYLPLVITEAVPFAELTLIALVLILVLLVLKLLLKPSYSDAYFIIALLTFITILYLQDPQGLAVFFVTLGISLMVAIIQDSYRMSFLDELTGLPARRALLDEMMKLSGTYSLAMVDIDFFKKFNDKHGHDVGDEVLRMVASCLSEVTGGGKAFRYGGEEFTIVFSNLDLKDALPHLEAIREKVQKRTFILKGNRKKSTSTKKKPTPSKKLSVTVSIGVAQKEGSTKRPLDVLKNADKALYRAKKKGRNCVSK